MYHALSIRCRPCSPSASAIASLLAHSIPSGENGNT
uniref:Uncharacterized protein n=1 Tax=Rhizophora mucronata TaxID=61149 RepID=A0A2P2QSX9_RHIMU